MQIESNILYALIKEARYELGAKVHYKWFNNPVNQELWKALVYCLRDKKACDIETLKTYIHENNYREIIRNNLINRINEIDNMVCVISSNIVIAFEQYYIENKFKEFQKHLEDENATYESKYNLFQKIHKEVNENRLDDTVYNFNEMINQFIDDIQEDMPSYFKTRSIELQSINNQKIFSKYIRPYPQIIASRPSMDKTSLIINLLIELIFLGKNGLFFSFEDSIETLRNKYLSMQKNWNTEKFMDCNFNETEKEILINLKRPVKKNRLWVSDKRYNILELRDIIDRQFTIRNYDFIILDYFQLFKRCYWKLSEAQEYEMITQEFISISKDYMVPLIFTSQVNDRSEKDGDVELHLGSLKGSGGLEQNARKVMIINGNRKESERIINTEKHTFGGLGKVHIRLNKESRLIEDVFYE